MTCGGFGALRGQKTRQAPFSPQQQQVQRVAKPLILFDCAHTNKLQAALSLGKVGSELEVAATQMLSSTHTHKRRVASTTAHKRHVGTLHSAAYKLSDKEERKLEDSIFDEPPRRTLHKAFKA
jgi:hypothetical protein